MEKETVIVEDARQHLLSLQEKIVGKQESISSLQEEIRSFLTDTIIDDTIEDEEKIKVPHEIKFENYQYGFPGIISADKCSILSYLNVHGGIPHVSFAGHISNKKALITGPSHLQLCKRKDLKAGDIAFKTQYIDINSDHISLLDLSNYCVILNNKGYTIWHGGTSKGMAISDLNWKYWYKVIFE